MSNSTMKACTKCGTEYPATIEFFAKQSRSSSGLHSWCKGCNSKRGREWAANNHDKVLANKKLYRQRHPERVQEQQRVAVAKKPEHYSEQQRAWRSANAEHVSGVKRTYRRINFESVRANNQKRRALKRASQGTFTGADTRTQLLAQKGLCWWCGCELNGEYHLDHRIPLNKGGSNKPNNIVCSCAKCNLSKGAKLPHEWIGRLL